LYENTSNGTVHHEYAGRHAEATCQQRRNPGAYTRGFSEGQKRVWRPGSPASRYGRNFEGYFSDTAVIYICIDAVDESTPKHRRDLLESMQEVIRVSPNTRLFLTGRPHISDEIVRYFSQALRIPLSPTHEDIKSYLEMRLKCDTDPNAMDDKLRADIMRIVPEKISQM